MLFKFSQTWVWLAVVLYIVGISSRTLACCNPQ